MHSFNPERLTAPATDLVSMEEIRRHCRVASDDDQHDDDLSAYVLAASAYLDGRSGILGRALISQGWRCAFSAFPAGRAICLMPGPVQAVTAVTYRQASDGAWTAISGVADWELLDDPAGALLYRPANEDWPDIADGYAEAVRVDFTAGYGDQPADVPQQVIQATKLLVGHWFENREAVVVGSVTAGELPLAVKALLAPLHHGSF